MDIGVLQQDISPSTGWGARTTHMQHIGRRSVGVPAGVSRVQYVRLVMLGEQGVGKSSIALRFVRDEFTENTSTTIGAAFLTHVVNVLNVCVKFEIWDTAGQERFHCLAPMYYRGAQAAVVVYDVTSLKSFQKAKDWIQELKRQTGSQTIIVLAGNKADMSAEKRDVSAEEARTYAEENNLIFTESSAKTGLCVRDIFMAVAQTFVQRAPKMAEPEAKGLKLGKVSEKKKDGICC